ncbi:MAG: metalloregulator ArsR/SmtB family transcription factor [archaeon]|nr:metalloregulator ArsR/SmtB family transcription factor [archaeon]
MPMTPDDDTVIDLADFFKVFSDSTRLRILWSLRDGEKCVMDISDGLDLSISAVSHQLKTLKDADLVRSRREGKQIHYSLCDEHVEILLSTAFTHIMEDK